MARILIAAAAVGVFMVGAIAPAHAQSRLQASYFCQQNPGAAACAPVVAPVRPISPKAFPHTGAGGTSPLAGSPSGISHLSNAPVSISRLANSPVNSVVALPASGGADPTTPSNTIPLLASLLLLIAGAGLRM